MKKIALVAAVLGLCALPACTTANPQRRTLTDWSLGNLREPADPCGSMPSTKVSSKASKDNCGGGNPDKAASGFIDAVFVKPVAFAMLPVAWVGDTLILNPINGWKKAEIQSYERRFCEAEKHQNWSDAHAAAEAGAGIPIAVPWIVTDLLAAPEFAARFVWNSVSATDPVCQDCYNAYWAKHNEKQPK